MEMCSLTDLEAGSLKSRCQQGRAPSEVSRGRSYLASSSSCGPRFPRLMATLLQSLPLSLCGLLPCVSLLCVSLIRTLVFFFFFFFFLNVLAAPCGMQDLSSQPGMEPVPPAVEAQGLNHWTAREVPRTLVFEFRTHLDNSGFHLEILKLITLNLKRPFF